ncbi:hypothetical protein ACFL3C_01295 [Patescibacteria group bacterium]
MGLPMDREAGSSFPLSTQVEGTVAAEQEKRILDILGSLSAIFAKVKEYYAVEAKEEEARQLAEEIDRMVSELITSFDAGQFSLLTEEERDSIDALRAGNREINAIGTYVETLVDLYSSIGTRDDVIGLIDLQSNDRFALQRAFLVKFLAAIQEFKNDQTVDNLIRVMSLVKAYERMQIKESIEQNGAKRHCERFRGFFNGNVMTCLRANGAFQDDVLDKIYEGANSLLGTLKATIQA